MSIVSVGVYPMGAANSIVSALLPLPRMYSYVCMCACIVNQVGWADSLSHRLYLMHKAMAMVAYDSGKKSNKISSGSSGSGSGFGGDELPRAGAMMAGLARQSQQLAVYIGLEDPPDAGDFTCGKLRGD